MAQYKTKAERNFEGRFKDALQDRRFDRVESLLLQYGYFMELACDDEHFGDANEVLIVWAAHTYDPDINLGDWLFPTFERESQVDAWLKEDAETARQAALYAFSGHPVPQYYMSID